MPKPDFIFNELYESGKEHYLQYKIKDNDIDTDNKESENEKDFAIYFWNNIQKYPNNIPECSRCIKDNKKLLELMNSNMEKDFKPKCTRYCLWYEWFDYKRDKRYFIENEKKRNKTNVSKSLDIKEKKIKKVLEKSRDEYAHKTDNLFGLMLEREDELDKEIMDEELDRLDKEIEK
jgi:hypothetical protein